MATLACDLLKGTLAVVVARAYLNDTFFISLAAIACVLGHVFSCFLGFKGGKAVATTIGVFLPLAFVQLLGSAALCILLIYLSGFVSLGSMTLVSSLPLFLAFSGLYSWIYLAIILAIIVFFKHRDNIKRLHAGCEKSWLKGR